MRKTRVKKLRKELRSILDFAYSGAKITPGLWRKHKRAYVRG